MNLEADRVVDFSLQLPEPYSMRLKKVCPQCDATLHARKLACPCGHVFPAKAQQAQQTKRKRPIESRQSDNVRKAARKACETGEETRKRQAQNQERIRQSETREQSMKRQAQNQERMASLRQQSETCEQSMKRQAQNQERMASLKHVNSP